MYLRFLLSIFICLCILKLEADERAPRGKCYVALGFVDSKSKVADFAKQTYIKNDYFEVFERKDKKLYFTLGKIDESLFKKLKNEGKTYDFNCASGKGYEKRYGLDTNFSLVNGSKKFLDTEAQFLTVVASIEQEKKRLADAEIQRQVEARLAEMERQRKLEEEAEKERQRLAELERKRKAEEEAEKKRILIAKQKADEEQALKLGFSNAADMKLSNSLGFKGSNEFYKESDLIMAIFDNSDLTLNNWIQIANKIGIESIIKSYKDSDISEWKVKSDQIYKTSINAPKLLLKCVLQSGRLLDRGTYYVSHDQNNRAQFIFVRAGNKHAREERYNNLSEYISISEKYYRYNNFKLNDGPSFVVRRNQKAYIDRTNGNLYISQETKIPGSNPEQYMYDGSTLRCQPDEDHQKFINLRDDFLQWKKDKEIREKQKLKESTKF